MRHAIAALVLAGLLLSGCAARPRSESEPVHAPEDLPEPVISQTEPKTVAQQLVGKEGVITLRITERGFEPRAINSTVGGRVRIHLVNASAGGHNLVIEKFGIASRTLAPGEENYIEFTPGEKGAWPITSDAPGEPEPAFRAMLKVE